MDMDVSILLNYLLGGGLVACIGGLLTMRSTIHKASAEADALQIQNTENATRVLMENIMAPLQDELKGVREELKETRGELTDAREELKETRGELTDAKKELSAAKREMARLRKALGEANTCKHTEECPVLYRLKKGENEQSKEICETLST